LRLFGVNVNAKTLCLLPLLRQINDRHYSRSNLHYTLPDTTDRTRVRKDGWNGIGENSDCKGE